MTQSTGPVILDLLGPELSAEEREILQHPLVGGVILFTRNYADPEQITQLCKEIRAARPSPLLITVDQEGGVVQRFRENFTRLPPMGDLGKLHDESPLASIKLAEECGWLMAAEILSVGIDLSFAPVLDLDKGLNTATGGGRPFHREPNTIITLAKAFIRGMKKAGMKATGKHFPGHGSVTVDSHLEMPVDNRKLDTVINEDLIPFKELMHTDLDAIMSAHILFPAIDDRPVGFSPKWLTDILRKEFKFTGIIFSDDLNMKGAGFGGDYSERARAALEAGCDLVLICNNREGAINILDRLPQNRIVAADKIAFLRGKFSLNFEELKASQEWKESYKCLTQNRRSHEYN